MVVVQNEACSSNHGSHHCNSKCPLVPALQGRQEKSCDYLAELKAADEVAHKHAHELQLQVLCFWVAYGSTMMGSIAILFCFIMLRAYVHISPTPVRLEIDNLALTRFDSSKIDWTEIQSQQVLGNGLYYSNVSLNFSVTLKYFNPNDNIDFWNEYTKVKLLYNGYMIGAVQRDPFLQARQSSLSAKFDMICDSLLLQKNVWITLLAELRESRMKTVMEIVLKTRIARGRCIWSPIFRVKYMCELHIIGGSLKTKVCKVRYG